MPDTEYVRGWVLFDGHCPLCSRLACRFGPMLYRHRLATLPLQTPWVNERLTQRGEQLLAEMRFLIQDGTLFGGADALIELARRIWWAKPIFWLSRVPGAKRVMRKAYVRVASRRSCLAGACQVGVDPMHAATRTPGQAQCGDTPRCPLPKTNREQVRSKRVFFEMP
jgi:predicted DCC family thiol-disulfide oxidoreductase YuxK